MSNEKPKYIVFCDTQNKEIDEEYAQKLICSFRAIIGWKVLPSTKIYDELRDFSKGYSKCKRDTNEVATIFAISHGIIKF